MMSDIRKKMVEMFLMVLFAMFTLGSMITPVNATAPLTVTLTSATGTYPSGTATSVDSGITVSSSELITTGTININGFVAGDTLTFTNSGGITGSYNASSGVLSISGSANAAAYQTFLRSVQFNTTSTSGSRAFEILLSASGTTTLFYDGHFYQYIAPESPGKTWTQSRTAASSMTYPGVTGSGYLANIASQAENDFITQKLGSDAWLGGSDSDLEGTWKWMDGPESGQTMSYTNWNPSEPNNAGGENYLEIYVDNDGRWNDLNGSQTDLGFVVEFGYSSYSISAASGSASKAITIVTTPTVTSVSPSLGAIEGGATVTITGANFTGATGVKFGSTDATSFTLHSSTSISATAPSHNQGTVDITVVAPSGTSPTVSGDRFTYAVFPLVTLSSGAVFLNETDGEADIIAILSTPTAVNVSVALSYSGDAARGTDYSAAATITIAAGNTSGAITLACSSDALDELNESLVIDISSITNGIEDGLQQLSLSITDDDESPQITSAATANFKENGTGAAYTCEGSDTDGDSVLWAISGTDAALFLINSSSGLVTFLTPPSFSAPTDADADNIYSITISARDGTNTTSKNVAISVFSDSSDDKKSHLSGEIIINGISQAAGSLQTTTNPEGQSVTTITMNAGQMNTILQSQGQGTTITIPITGSSNVSQGILTGDVVNAMEQNDSTLVVQTDSATYTLPAEEININAISEKFGESVSLADISVTVRISEPSDSTVSIVEDASSEGNFAIVVPAVEFTISCSYNNQTVEVSSFNSYVERRIAIPEGVDQSKITTAIVVDQDGTVHHVPTRIVLIDGKHYAIINSLTNSTYALVYNPIEFADVKSHWAKDAINSMGSRMVVSGVGNNCYEPDAKITRAEFAAIIVRALGLSPSSQANQFADIPLDSWYQGYVGTAVSYGIITGYGQGLFGPDDYIIREQAMAMIGRAMRITKFETSISTEDMDRLLSVFTDGKTASSYARESIAACLDTGIIAGDSPTKLELMNPISRAEVAVIIQRLLEKSELI